MTDPEYEEAAQEVAAIPRDHLPDGAARAYLIAEALAGRVAVYTPMGQTAYNVWLEEERRRIPLGDWLQERYGQYQGYCLGCGEHRRRSQCREVRPEGYPLSLAVWVCLTC